MDLGLNDKRAFVSGSTQGIGYAIAHRLLEEGATVIINGRSEASVGKALQRLRADFPAGRVSGIAADLGKQQDISNLLQQLGQVDILINNAGIFEPKPFLEIPDEDWLRFFEVNVLSGIRLSRALFPAMLEKNWGRIIFITSESAFNIPEEMVHYGMTKTAMHAVSRGLAELTKNSGVTVNTVMPGPTASEGVEGFIDKLAKDKGQTAAEVEADFFRTARPTSLVQRFTTPAEVANMVAYVASTLASATNGASLRADGGVVKSVF